MPRPAPRDRGSGVSELSTPIANPAPAADPAAHSATAESLGWQLRGALPPLRLHSVSIYDHTGEVRWLSEGALGPDEHGFVQEALSTMSAQSQSQACECDFGDGRAAVFLAVRSPHGDLIGLAMILMDAKSCQPEGLGARILTAQVRTILQRIAVLLRPSEAPQSAPPIPLPDSPALSASAPQAPAARQARASEPPASTAPAPGSAPIMTAPAPPERRAPAGRAVPGRPEQQERRQAPPVKRPPATAPAAPSGSAASASPGRPASSPASSPFAGAMPERSFGSLDWPASAAPAAAADTPSAASGGVLGPKTVDSMLSQTEPQTHAPTGPQSPAQPAAGRGPHWAAPVEPSWAPPPAASPRPAARSAPAMPPVLAPAGITAPVLPPGVSPPVLSPAVSAPRVLPPPGAPVTTAPLVVRLAAQGAVPAPVQAASTTRTTVAPATAAATPTSRGVRSVGAPEMELWVQELALLRPGGRTRRFHVLPPENRAGSAHTRTTITGAAAAHLLLDGLEELLGFLATHADLQDPFNFSIAVPPAALEVEELPEAIARCFRASGVQPDLIGFEIPEALCVQRRMGVERLIRAIDKLGCALVLDEFAFDTAALEFLRSRALRVVQVDTRLIAAALRDKLAQARVVAILQAARVLGVHCVAKNVEAETTRRWLTAAGFDLACGPLFEGPRLLRSLTQAASQPV